MNRRQLTVALAVTADAFLTPREDTAARKRSRNRGGTAVA